MTRFLHFLLEVEPYVLQGLLGLVALFGILKDWNDYGEASGRFKKPVRITVLVVTLIVILLLTFETYNSRSEARKKEETANQKEAASKMQIDGLTEQISQEREENKHNADGFRESFATLYQKYSDLAARVQNADLLREIIQTRKDLKATQEKLTQPKARLTASFYRPGMTTDNGPRETTGTKHADGSIAFDLVVANPGDVPALHGNFTIYICDQCRFSTEPIGSVHVSGSSEQERQFFYGSIPPHTLTKFTIEVTTVLTSFEVGTSYTCDNCVPNPIQPLMVNVQ